MEQLRQLGRELARVASTLVFVSLVSVATAGIANPLVLAIVLSAAVAIVVIRVLFPASRLLSITFGNLIAVYTAIFSLFVEESFSQVNVRILGIGFCLPIAFFIVGCWLRRGQIRPLVDRPSIRDKRRLMQAAAWLAPISLVGASVFLLSRPGESLAQTEMIFLGAMFIIGLIVLLVSRDVATFLVDVGLLFEEFFSRVSGLLIPAVAFLSFYSVLVILFASAYRIISQYTYQPHFYVGNIPRALSFSESIYFSIITISTVGYGDIIPHSSFARVLASLEVIRGYLLLLFGVSELLEYAREHRRKSEIDR
jgi:voltage-gated potassium channel